MTDERFLIHRLKATRLAAIAGVVVVAGWYSYYFFGRNEMHHDLLSVMIVMGVTKLAAMAYYRRTN